KRCKIFQGVDYILLREAVRKQRQKASMKRRKREIVLSLGGSRLKKSQLSFLQQLFAQFPQQTFRWFYAYPLPKHFKVLPNVTLTQGELAPALARGQLAILGGGVTLAEAAYFGT